MVGVLDDVRKIVTQGFKNEGDLIALLGTTNDDDLTVSEYAAACLNISTDEMIASGEVPKLDLEIEKIVQKVCCDLAQADLLKSAHDCSEGGVAVAIAESCFSCLNRNAIGAEIDLKDENLSTEKLLFVESPSRIVISFAPENLEKIEQIAANISCPFTVLGKVGSETLKIRANGAEIISNLIGELEITWRTSLGKQLEAGAVL
jgi:phosphoribosylformylglycinamidine synthase